MDADVEMVPRRGKNELVPSEEFVGMTRTQTVIQQQNRCFTTGMVSFLVAILFVIGFLYQEEDTMDMPEVEYRTDSGDIKDGTDNSKIVEEAFGGKMNPEIHNHHNEISAWMKKHMGFNTTKESTIDSDLKIKNWLDAKVSLEDGVKYEVVAQLNHDKKSFTEGLCYANGKLYESVGMQRHSALLVLDPATGDTLERYDMDASYFGEGLTYVDRSKQLLQLTYTRKDGFIYDVNDLSKQPTKFKFETTTGEGWGFTYDPDNHELIVSDGSEFLHYWDPDTLKEKRKVAVHRLDGKKATEINELEYWRGRVLANVWYLDILLVINPVTGSVEKEYDFSSLWLEEERRKQRADVLNGISISEDPDLLYITGKYWDRMFLVRLL